MNKTSHAIVRTLLLGTSCLSVAALVVGAAMAQPTGGQVVYGGATITNNGPNSTVIDQKTGKAIINWNSFSIGAGGTVKFNQPNANSIALNRVLGGEGSSIYGNLLANGQVWIINQNGILFGKGSTINVGGLIATTRDVSDTNFAAGNYSFSGDSGASVINQGTIRTKNGGDVVLSGAGVQNQGLIQADTGTVVLGGASAFTVDFVGDGLLKYAITEPTGAADNGQTGVSNSGTIKAAGGRVIMTARAAADVQGAVVNNTGMISATSAKLQNGEVILDGGANGDVVAGGTIDASGAGHGQTGGFVSITGHNVTVADNTNINVSGDAGGGKVLIGGDVHGEGTLQNAANTHVGRATINANATRTGNGGTLVVWSNGITDFSGIFSAKGGTLFGNGGFVETSGQHLSVSPDAKVDTTAPRGNTGTWLLDPQSIVITSGEGSNASLDGNGKLALATDPGQTDYISPTTIINALATTNVTLEASDYIEVDSDVIYASSHALSLMSEGNIFVYSSIQNTLATGGGAINLVAGWDGVTAPGQVLFTPNAYGNSGDGEGQTGVIAFFGDYGNVYVGSASGTTTVAGAAAILATDEGGNVQLGYHGAGGGDINVFLNADLALFASAPSDTNPFYAQIGNGALDGSVSGAVTGNIHVQIDGILTLATGFTNCDCNSDGLVVSQSAGDGRTISIGNETTGTATGSVLLFGADTDDADDENGGLGRIIFNDIAYGDVTLGRVDQSAPMLVGGASYNSAHNLTLLSKGDILVDSPLMNDGTGAITMLAGWSGLYDASNIGAAGTYGLNNGTITIGGPDAVGSVYVGTHSGALTLYGANLTVDASVGNAQLGYHGAGGGNIFITMTGNVTVQGGGDTESNTVAYAQIGNGSLLGDVTGNVTGNITINAGQFASFDGDNGEAWLGNVAASGSTETGNLTLLTQNGFFTADYIASDLQGGDVFIGFTDPEVTPLYIGGFHYNAPHDFTFAGAGSMNVTGGVQNAGSGAVTLVAGWDGHTVGTAAQLQAAGAYGIGGATMNFGNAGQFENAEVGSAHGLTTILTGDLILAPQAGYRAQIGYHGTGGGDIHVVASGDLTLTGGSAQADYALIGNGSLNTDVTGAVTGNIDVRVGGLTSLDSGTGLANAWIGNKSTGTSTGNIVFVSGSFENSGSLGAMFASDLNGGDVTFALTDPNAEAGIDTPIAYNSSHTLSLLFAGNAFVLADLQNAGTGAINLIAGWDGHTLDAAHFLDAGVYGNNSGSIVVGTSDATGSASIGSFGGKTTVAAATIAVQAVNANAQIGYHGNGATGAITVKALNGVSVSASGNNVLAQIGNFATTGNATASGDIIVDAGSLSLATSGNATTAMVGNLATSGGSESGNVTVNTHGGALSLNATGAQSHAHIGHWTTGNTSGTSAGNITIDAGAINLVTQTGNNYAQIGNGAFRFGSDAGAVSGNITIHATTFQANATGTSQARLGNLGVGAVSGDILIATTGNYVLAADGGLISIGNVFGGSDANSQPLQGLATGNMTVQSGGTITLQAINGGTSRIETGGAASGNVNVTAAGDIILSAGTSGGPGSNSSVLIGALTAGNTSLNTSVTSTGGLVRLVSFESGAAANIGSVQNGNLAGTMSGTVSVSAANGSVQLNTQGDATSVARIGNMGDNGAVLSGAVSVLAGQVINLNGASTAIGEIDLNSGTAATVSGNVSLTANIISSISTVPVRAATLNITQTGTGGGVGANTAPLLFNASALNLTGAGANFFLTSSGAVALGNAALGTGVFAMTAGGAITQTGTITAGSILFTTTSGAIALTSTANAVSNQVALNGAGAVTFYNTLTTNVAGTTAAGGDLTLLSKGNVNFLRNVQSNTGAITVVAGWDGTTTNAANFGNSGVYGNGTGGIISIGSPTTAPGNVAVGSKSGTTSFYGKTVLVNAVNGNAQLGYHGAGGGAIVVRTTGDVNLNAPGTFSAMIGNGSFTTDVTGNITGDLDVRAGGNLNFTGTSVQFGNLAHSGTSTGNLTIIAADVNGADSQFTGFLLNAIGGGDVILGFTGTGDQGNDGNVLYNSSHNLTVLTTSNFIAAGSIQNAGSGAVTVVAGWDGHTLSGFGNAGVAGNNGKGVTIGGSLAASNVALGSAGGQTSVYGASLAITAVNGYAQLGYNGHGTGAILVNVSGALTMTGGSGTGQFAQLGNGGRNTTGSNSGNISVTAGGAITLTSGAGNEAYVQMGHGGAESNSGAAQGYSNQGTITVSGQEVILNAGLGQAAYVQIGHGGYKVGAGITGGTATNSGNISITSAHTVVLNGNSATNAGTDAYVQIGNGGGQSNLNPSASANGTDGGDIVVTAPNGANGSVTLLAGFGANSYAQIGNGGYAANSGPSATAANWTITGNITVTDLGLTGGQGSGNEFAQIGNGDASKNSVANVSGNIVINANGQITYTTGKAPTSPATIGNFTGTGTTSGTLDGAAPPSSITTDPVIIGVIVGNTPDNNNNNGNNNITTINTTVLPPSQDTSGGATNVPPPSSSTTPGALASLDNGGDSSEPNTSDSATTLIADSLDGAKKAGSSTILAGMLKQTNPSSSGPHGVPPADQDFSSWGNEALWQ